jgi:formylglycine-generating enzyme required for sulfatase activity
MVDTNAGFCIDATEVTRAAYRAWLATGPALPPACDPACGWKTSYDPIYVWDTGTEQDQYPATAIDWCDAYAYCKGVGKRLCGKIGGGPNFYNDLVNPSLSQWYHACTSGSNSGRFPYGDTYDPYVCNGPDYGSSTSWGVLPVGFLPDCRASYADGAVLDLSGNAWEWEDSCDGSGPSTPCRIRGGAYWGTETAALTCGYATASPRYVTDMSIGFRCCAP